MEIGSSRGKGCFRGLSEGQAVNGTTLGIKLSPLRMVHRTLNLRRAGHHPQLTEPTRMPRVKLGLSAGCQGSHFGDGRSSAAHLATISRAHSQTLRFPQTLALPLPLPLLRSSLLSLR